MSIPILAKVRILENKLWNFLEKADALGREIWEELDIEPNARKTIEIYVERFCKN